MNRKLDMKTLIFQKDAAGKRSKVLLVSGLPACTLPGCAHSPKHAVVGLRSSEEDLGVVDRRASLDTPI